MRLPVLLALLLQLAALAQGRPQHLSRARRQAAGGGSGKQQQQQKAGKQWEQECLAAHNKWRRFHNAPELTFDRKISQFAQKRAEHIAHSDGAEFRHPDDLVYGENLAWHSRPSTSCADLIKMWYDELELYDFGQAKFSHETGHFTQLVWKDTRKVGCARALSPGPKGGVYLVCNYDPPGNFLGEAGANVERRLARPPTLTTSTSPAPSTTLTTTSTTSTSTSTTKAPAKKKGKKKSPSKAPSTTRSPLATTTTTISSTSTSTSTKRPGGADKKNKKRKKKGGKKKRKKTTTTTTTTTGRPQRY